MSQTFINGTKIALATAVAAAVPITAISNANPGVALTGTPPVNGDIVILKSGWSSLNDTVARAAGVVAATSFQLEGVNTTDTDDYPAGEGAGTFEVASTFVSLSQVRDIDTSGGDSNSFDWQYVEDKSSRLRSRPTTKSPIVKKITLDYDADLPWYAALKAADRGGVAVVLRETLPSGEVIYNYGFVSFNGIPTGKVNENLVCTAEMRLLAEPIRYAAP